MRSPTLSPGEPMAIAGHCRPPDAVARKTCASGSTSISRRIQAKPSTTPATRMATKRRRIAQLSGVSMDIGSSMCRTLRPLAVVVYVWHCRIACRGRRHGPRRCRSVTWPSPRSSARSARSDWPYDAGSDAACSGSSSAAADRPFVLRLMGPRPAPRPWTRSSCSPGSGDDALLRPVRREFLLPIHKPSKSAICSRPPFSTALCRARPSPWARPARSASTWRRGRSRSAVERRRLLYRSVERARQSLGGHRSRLSPSLATFRNASTSIRSSSA